MIMTDQQRLYEMGRVIIALCNQMVKFAEEKELVNSETLLNILDELNEISVKY